LACLVEPGDVDCGVVLRKGSGGEQDIKGLSAGGNDYALGYGVFIGPNGYRDLYGSEAVVGYVDGNQPVSGLFGSGENVGDGQVGQAFVGVDPVVEEPGKVATCAGLFE
jgi:hypothetical protein